MPRRKRPHAVSAERTDHDRRCATSAISSGPMAEDTEAAISEPLRPGDDEYHAFVGRPEQFDLMGATQFALLFALGMRSTDRLLDVGCGSLRAGRLIAAYLDPGHYVGIEPNGWLVRDAIASDLGQEFIDKRQARFFSTSEFTLPSGQDSGFDFVLAQSIASHTGPQMTLRLLGATARWLAPSGLAAVTFVSSVSRDNTIEGWTYPDVVRYRKSTIRRWLRESGLVGRPIPWFHPRQTWWIVARDPSVLPPRSARRALRGVSLAAPLSPSWRHGERLVHTLAQTVRGVAPRLAPGIRRVAARYRSPG